MKATEKMCTLILYRTWKAESKLLTIQKQKRKKKKKKKKKLLTINRLTCPQQDVPGSGLVLH